jgi:hypothetical protein
MLIGARRHGRRLRFRPSRLVSIALVLGTLFPYISATDDLLRAEHLHVQAEHRHLNGTPSQQNQTDDLLRLYETMDSPLVGSIYLLVFALCFVALVFYPRIHAANRLAPHTAGRSPPCLLNA